MVEIFIESDGKGNLDGRVLYNQNLIVVTAGSLPQLEEDLRRLLHEYEGLDPSTVQFLHRYEN